jgi:hypothetical protein
MAVTYARGAELPAFSLWLYDSAGTLINFSSGYTFVLRLGYRGQMALLTKAGAITGAVGSGTGPTGAPNVSVAWAAGELNIAAAAYVWELTATSVAGDRVFQGPFTVVDVIGAAGTNPTVDIEDGGGP